MSLNPSSEQLEPAPDRLVVRPLPERATLARIGIVLFPGSLCLLGLYTLFQRSPGALVIIATGVAGGFWYYAAAIASSIWADSDWVGVSRPFPLPSPSVRRTDLDSLRVSRPTRSGPGCSFVRKDGKTAFRVSVGPYGMEQLSRMASYLNVPLVGFV